MQRGVCKGAYAKGRMRYARTDMGDNRRGESHSPNIVFAQYNAFAQYNSWQN